MSSHKKVYRGIVLTLLACLISIGIWLIVFTDWFTNVSIIRYLRLQFCTPQHGLVFNSAIDGVSELWRIETDGNLQLIPALEGQNKIVPKLSPDARHLLFVLREPTTDHRRVFVACADGTRAFPVTDFNSNAGGTWVNSHTVLYNVLHNDVPEWWNVEADTWLLDLRTGQVSPQENLFQFIDRKYNPLEPDWATSLEWKKEHWFGQVSEDYWLANIKSGEKKKILQVTPGKQVHGAWSPDGKYLAFSITFSDETTGKGWGEIYLMPRDGSSLEQLTTFGEFSNSITPNRIAWSPDGKKLAMILFDSEYYREEQAERLAVLYIADRQLRDLNVQWDTPDTPVWSPDSRRIAFVTFRQTRQRDIFAISIDSGEIQQLTDSPETECDLSWY